MAAFHRGKLFVTPWMLCRHRSKFNVKKPRPGHTERQLMVELTKPILKEDLMRKPHLACSVLEEKDQNLEKEVNLYEQFLVKECRRVFEEHRMVIVCQPRPLKGKELTALRNKLIHGGMQMVHDFTDSVIRQAIASSPWQNMCGLFIGHERLIVSNNDCIGNLVKLAKRNRDFVLLGGVFDGRLYSHGDLQHYAGLPDLHTLQGQTVGILNGALSRTTSLLSHHQGVLTRSLDSLAASSSQTDSKES